MAIPGKRTVNYCPKHTDILYAGLDSNCHGVLKGLSAAGSHNKGGEVAEPGEGTSTYEHIPIDQPDHVEVGVDGADRESDHRSPDDSLEENRVRANRDGYLDPLLNESHVLGTNVGESHSGHGGEDETEQTLKGSASLDRLPYLEDLGEWDGNPGVIHELCSQRLQP